MLILRRPRLRTHPPAIMLDREDVAVGGRGPLPTLHRHIKITQCITDVALNVMTVAPSAIGAGIKIGGVTP
jgi:hypothetical protein